MGQSTAASGDLDHSTLGRLQAAVSTTKSLSFPTHIRGLDKIASKVSSNTAKLSLLNLPKESGVFTLEKVGRGRNQKRFQGRRRRFSWPLKDGEDFKIYKKEMR